MDFTGRLVKLEEEEEDEKKPSLIGRVANIFKG
jgi:hypothetical protein